MWIWRILPGFSSFLPARSDPKPRRLLARVALTTAAALAVAGQALAQASFRGLWVDAFSPGYKSTSQISSLIQRASSARYNAIIVEVLAYQDRGSTGHGAYWNSALVPKATDIVGGIDPLAVVVQQGHAAGLEVHAWIVPYRVSTTWPPPGNAYLAARPHWLMVPLENMGGGPAPVDGRYVLDPGSPEVQEYLVSIVRELVANYAIDGINLDYIRYTNVNAGYPAYSSYEGSTLARFRGLTGYVGTPPAQGEPSWNDFRRRTIDELVRRLRAEIPAITSNPRQPLRLTADLICWGYAPSDFTATDAYRLHQNWRLWLERGWLDAGIPMNYKREYSPSEAAMYRDWVDTALGWRYQRHLFGGQGNYLNRKADSVTQMQYALSAGTDGVVNFCYYETADENTDGVPENDWTWYTYVANNLFTSAVPTPTMPWRNAATAVEGTLWGRVTDPATGNPIDGATVQVGTLPSVETDGNGYFVVTLIPAGPGGTSYGMTVRKSGCPDVYVTSVVIYPGTLVRHDVEICNSAPQAGDMDLDGDIDVWDLQYFVFCMQGPGVIYDEGHFCLPGDADGDFDLDLRDLANFQRAFTGPD